MATKPIITIIGFPEIKRDPRALFQACDYRLPDLLSLKDIRKSNLVLLDLRAGLPEWSKSKDFPAVNGDEDDALKIARKMVSALKKPGLLAEYLGLSEEDAKLFWFTTHFREIAPFLQFLVSNDYGPPHELKCRDPWMDIGVKIESPFVGIYRHLHEIGVLEKLLLSPLRNVYEQVWQAVAESRMAVIVLPVLPIFTKKSDIANCYMDAVARAALYKAIVPSIQVREAPKLKPIPSAASSKNLDTAIDKFLYGHVDFLGESSAEIKIRPENGMTSSDFSPQFLSPHLKANIAAGFCDASVDNDGHTRSLLVRCGLGSAVILGGTFDTKGLAEYAVSCILDPKRSVPVAGLPVKETPIPLVFTLEGCQPSLGHDGFVVRIKDKEVKLPMKRYLTLLAFAVASECPIRSIDLTAPKIGGIKDGTSIEGLLLSTASGSERGNARRVNEKFNQIGLAPVVVSAPKEGHGKTVYMFDTSKYRPDLSRLSGCTIESIKFLLDQRPKAT